MTTTRYTTTACPDCGTPLSAATGVDDGTTPKDGDVSLCIRCGAWLVFTNNADELRPITEDEIEKLPDETFELLTHLTNKIVEIQGGSA